jgi:3-methyladenine DNA glycosylase Tag
MATNNTSIFGDPTGTIEALGKLIDQLKISAKSVSDAFESIEGGALALNKQFGQGRQRISELKLAVADATPAIDRLGGSLYDAVETTKEISDATRRNVIASTEDITKLYSASKITGTGVKELVEGFQEVGFQFSQVGPQIEKSVGYIQSVGVNAGAVMSKVMENMGQMNRFNFQDGVLGLTKMATQATLLKFDMGQVFTLANDALDPEGAIKISSAFQRLGLAAGGLTDPFELMYKSLNDPEGLQDSLVDMTKQFTYFDEKTKSFKINPAGMLQLRELQKETGLSAAEMSKLALNTADLDRKLSMLRPSLKFENEEDKMYLANIAKMDKEGNYKVDFVDKRGEKISENIENLNQEQLDFLINQEKNKPQGLEEIQRSQLHNIEVMAGDMRAIRDKLVYGFVSAPKVSNLAEDIGTIGKIVTDTLNKGVKQEDVRKQVDTTIGDVTGILSKMAKGEKVGLDLEALEKTTKGIFDFDKLKDKIMGFSGEINKQIPQTIKDRYKEPSNDFSKLFEKMTNWFDNHDGKYSKDDDFPKYSPKNSYSKDDDFPKYSPKNSYSKDDDFPNKKGLSVTTIDTGALNIGDKGLTELFASIGKSKYVVGIPTDISDAFKSSFADIAGQVGITNGLTEKSNNILNEIAKNIKSPVNKDTALNKRIPATDDGFKDTAKLSGTKVTIGSTDNKDTALNTGKPASDDGFKDTAKLSGTQTQTNNYATNASYYTNKKLYETSIVKKSLRSGVPDKKDLINNDSKISDMIANTINVENINIANRSLAELLSSMARKNQPDGENFVTNASYKGMPNTDSILQRKHPLEELSSENSKQDKKDLINNDSKISDMIANTINVENINIANRSLNELLSSMTSKQQSDNNLKPDNRDKVDRINLQKIDGADVNSTDKKNMVANTINTENINIANRSLSELLSSIADKQKTIISGNPLYVDKNSTNNTSNVQKVSDVNLTKDGQIINPNEIQIPKTGKPNKMGTPIITPVRSSYDNRRENVTQKNNDSLKNAESHTHTFDGNITWRIDAPPELDTKRFYAMIDKQEFKEAFYKIVIDKFKETEQQSFYTKSL